MSKKIGIAGLGALGSFVARALESGIDGYTLHAISDPAPKADFGVPNIDFDTLAKECDLIIETLPPAIVPDLCRACEKYDRDILLISSSAAILHPEIMNIKPDQNRRIIVPSGALCGLDGVASLMQMGIKTAKITTTKKPMGYDGAPYIVENNIDLTTIDNPKQLFSGNARQAAQAFPANINVAATLSLASLDPEDINVEIWCDPNIVGNKHQIEIEGKFSKITTTIENTPDPTNPKSSMLAAASIVSVLKKLEEPIIVI